MKQVNLISKKILNEIASQTEDPIVKELARTLLEFEMENWKMEKKRYKKFFNKIITKQCKKRTGST